MASADVFSGGVHVPNIAASNGSHGAGEVVRQFPSLFNRREEHSDSQATPVTFIEERPEWLSGAHRKLSQLSLLHNDWDSYGADAPSKIAIQTSQNILTVLAKEDFASPSIDASVEGGICISFQRDNRYGDIECFNSGEVLAVISAGGDETEAWEINNLVRDLPAALSKIRNFVNR